MTLFFQSAKSWSISTVTAIAPVKKRGQGDKGTRGQGDKGDKCERADYQLPITNAQCPTPNL
ncbi:hypothetical protein [Tolypothrix sp. VBCCA 56010]|uniref:hypothetical protein n=1 Tax=Tolypothrix sp. VBCCA 56010 TaxID=3137731 RepID=UPI003D7D4433